MSHRPLLVGAALPANCKEHDWEPYTCPSESWIAPTYSDMNPKAEGPAVRFSQRSEVLM